MEGTLENKSAALILSGDGMPGRWLLKGEAENVQEFQGRSGCRPEAVLRRWGCLEDISAGMQLMEVREEKERLTVRFGAEAGMEIRAEAELVYTIRENSFFLTWGEVRETEGWHLIEVTLPSLVSSPAREQARFLHGENRGGYLANLNTMDENSQIRGESRFGGYPNASVLPVLGLLRGKALCVMEVQGYVCRTLLAASVREGITFGVMAPYRIRGKEETPDIPVNQKEIARVEFAFAPPGREEVTWMDAARLVRNHFQPLKDDFFDDKFVYIVQNQLGRRPAELDYGQTQELLCRIGNIIGGNAHVAFLTGWSQGGHDTSYPNAYTMNPLLGSEEDFQNLRRKAKEECRCTVSLNDNFDDMYRNEFTREWFQEKYVARTAQNQLETFETWNGTDQSYITGMHNYMKPGEDGEKRIRCHGEQHQLEHAILIDALSWWSVRNDWNPRSPASAADNLRAKFRIIDEFYEKYGIHVLSELVRYPFIGKLSVAFDNSAAYARPSDRDIPFLRSVLRGVMYYGGRGGDDLDVPDMLYHNAAKHPWFRKGEKAERIADIYYLNYVPWFLLKKLEIVDYRVEKGVYDLYLEKDAHIHIDDPAHTWYVDYEGERILENYSLAYGGLGGRVIADAQDCFEDGGKPGRAWIEEGTLYAQVKASIPCLVELAHSWNPKDGERKRSWDNA